MSLLTNLILNGRRQEWGSCVDMDMPVIAGTGPLLGWADSGDSRLSSTPSSGEEGGAGGRPTLKRCDYGRGERCRSWHAVWNVSWHVTGMSRGILCLVACLMVCLVSHGMYVSRRVEHGIS